MKCYKQCQKQNKFSWGQKCFLLEVLMHRMFFFSINHQSRTSNNNCSSNNNQYWTSNNRNKPSNNNCLRSAHKMLSAICLNKVRVYSLADSAMVFILSSSGFPFLRLFKWLPALARYHCLMHQLSVVRCFVDQTS